MDTDLSLIEMSGEDDSLLQQLPNDDACSVYSSSSFSPLYALKPPKPSPQALGFAVMEDSERSSMPTCKEGVDKENAIWNKPEMPKLSIEPQQMKRKKKGGCYNLRKSLAWDKAFFTEEGVLDLAELSMISGNLNSLAGEKLAIIHEEGRELLSEVPGQRNDLTNLPSCDEKLFKNFPVKATGGSKRTVGCYSLQKHNSLNKTGSITFTAKQRVLSAQGANMSVSEHNGPTRPMTSSSLKRPINAKTTKGATKDSKVIRMPVAQTNSGLAISIAKSSIPSGHLRRTQHAQPSIKDNNIRVQSSLSIRKAVANSGFPGPSTKSSTSKSTLPQAKRNVSKVAAKQSSSTQVKVASERPQDQVNQPVHHVPNGDPGDSSEMEVPLPQTSEKVDIQLPTVPIQAAKPSGLRMSSPSIRFFYQNLAKKYVHPKNIPQPTSATSRKPCSVKILQDMSTPLGHDQLQQLISNSPSRSSSTAPPALTDLSISSHKKLESDPEFYGVRKTEPRLHNFPTGSNSNNGQTMQNPSDVGKQDIEIVKPCEDIKQLSSHEGNLKVNEDEALLSLDPCRQKIKDEDKNLIDILCEAKDADRRAHTLAITHDGFLLPNGDISMANPEEPFMLSSEIDNSFNDNYNIWTIENQTEASDELCKCVCAENADCISVNYIDTMCKSDGSQAQDYSVGLKVGMAKSDVEDAVNPDHDIRLTISNPMEGSKFAVSSKDVSGTFIEDTDLLACQNMDHSLSTNMEPLIESLDTYTDLHLRNDAQLCDNTNNLIKELSIVMNDYQSKGETTEAGFVNLRDSLSGAIFSTWELEADHSIYVLASTLEVENHSQRVDNLIENKDVEKNQFHPLVQKICQDVLSPTLGTNGQCSDDILTGNFKGESSPGNKCMLIIKPQIVGSDVGDTDNYQTLVEGEYADPAGGEIDGANDMKPKMVFVQESTSNNNFLSNCTAKDEPVTTGDLVEQLGNHLDLQDCSVLNDLSIDKGEHVQDDNSFHESHEKYFDSNPCDSELAMHIIPRGAEPDPSGGPDIVDGEAEKHDAQNTHDGKGSHLSNKLEVGDSPHMIDEKIIKPPSAAHDKETYPLSEAIHSESIGSYVEADPPLEHYNFNIQLHYHSKSTSHPATLGEGTLQEERCKDNHKPNGLLIKSPTYDLPFSDEWLATSEAGLEILTLKSGAVQHSPPDKTTRTWSLVKRKKRHDREIGPFDCTKFTITDTNVPHSSPQ